MAQAVTAAQDDAVTAHPDTPLSRRLKAVPPSLGRDILVGTGRDARSYDNGAIMVQRSAHLDGRDAKAVERLLDTMRIVKSARFNAATRLERKQSVSLFTQSMVALYFIGLAVWQAVYVGQIDEPTQRLLTFLSIVASVFTLMLALLEALNDYQMKAHHLHNCALAVSELSQDLDIERPTDVAMLQDYRRRYNEVLKACPVNHSQLDYQMARRPPRSGTLARAEIHARYLVNVYGLYAVFLVVPPLLWFVHQ